MDGKAARTEKHQRGHETAPRGLVRALAIAAMLTLTVAAQERASTRYEQTVFAIQEQIERGNLEQARGMVGEALGKHPHDGGVENLLGVIEIQEGHRVAANAAFAAAIKDSPRLTGAYLNLIRIKMPEAVKDQMARAETLRLVLKALQLDPANDEGHYDAATILNWNKEYRASLAHLEKLSAESQNKIGAVALYCADAVVVEPAAKADAAAAALAANPDLTEEDANTCLPALRMQRRADLIDMLLTAAGKRQALSPAGMRMLGLAEEAEGKLDAARATLERAFEANGKSVELLEDLTRVAKATNDNQGALGYLAHARDLEPKNAEFAYEFGTVCVRMGLLAEARKAIAEALRIEPENADYNLGMGMVVSFSEDPSQSLPYLAKYHALRPKDAEGALALGTANYRAKDYDTAAKWLRQAVAEEKTAADARFYLGRIARQEGRLDDAIAELKQSLALRKDQPDCLAELGQISVQQRAFTDAANYFQRALEKDHDNYAANFGLLQLYARTGDERREQQARRFDEVKNLKEERDRQMMRVIEVRPNGASVMPE